MSLNKVATSSIVVLNLFDYKPTEQIEELDIKDYLYMELVAKEKDFKASIATLDDSWLHNKAIAVVCSSEAILPPWLFMVIANKLYANTAYFDFTNVETLKNDLWKRNLQQINWDLYKDKKVVLKASSEIPPSIYIEATKKLKPLVKTLMYGEIGLPKVIFKN